MIAQCINNVSFSFLVWVNSKSRSGLSSWVRERFGEGCTPPCRAAENGPPEGQDLLLLLIVTTE